MTDSNQPQFQQNVKSRINSISLELKQINNEVDSIVVSFNTEALYDSVKNSLNEAQSRLKNAYNDIKREDMYSVMTALESSISHIEVCIQNIEGWDSEAGVPAEVLYLLPELKEIESSLNNLLSRVEAK